VPAAGAAATVALLWWFSQVNYPLFHTLVETFSIAVAVAIFMMAWNARRFLQGGFLLFIGIAYLFVGGLDLTHTLAYKGLGVFRRGGSNTAAQLRIAGRYLEAASLVLAPAFATRKLKSPAAIMAGFAAVVALVLTSVFRPWPWLPDGFRFPDCYVGGLTPFKVVSEYIICGLLLAALAALLRRPRKLDPHVVRLIAASILLAIASEFCFTLYVDVYGYVNMLGHLFKVASFYLIYQALIVTGLAKPYDLLFRELRTSRDALQEARDLLDRRVRERTADLARTVGALEQEVRARRRLQAEVLRVCELERTRIGQDLHDTVGQMLGGISCLSQVLSRKLAALEMAEAGDAATIERAAVESLEATRALARGLSPLSEQADGLLIALRDLAFSTESMFGVRCAFDGRQDVRLADRTMAVQMYHIAQEAVANATRHAKAEMITIELSACDGRIVITVTDDGVGIGAEAREGPGMGLRNMRYRAESIDAALEIGPGPHGGTVVRCSAPQAPPA